MKINIPDTIKKTGQEFSLTESERGRLLRTVTGYMEMKPRREPNKMPHQESFFFGFYGRQVVAAGLMIAIIFSGAGVSYAAEGALPGDVLYPVKVGINEEVVAALNVSTESRAVWEAERAGRRLDEAAKLAVAGKLTTKAKEEIAHSFENHSEKAVAGVEAIEKNDAPAALDLAADFEATLDAHQELLAVLDEDHEAIAEKVRSKVGRAQTVKARVETSLAFNSGVEAPTPKTVALFATSVTRESAQVASDTSENDTSQKDSGRKDAALRMKVTAQKSLSGAKDASARIARKLNENEKTRVDAQLSGAADYIADGDVALNDGDTSEAFRDYQDSFKISQKLVVFLKAGARINVDLRRLPLPMSQKFRTHTSENGGNETEVQSEDSSLNNDADNTTEDSKAEGTNLNKDDTKEDTSGTNHSIEIHVGL